MDIDAANNARDRRLRKRLLVALHRARAGSSTGWINARLLLDAAGGGAPGNRVEDDDHARALLGYLADSGYAEQRDERTHRHQRPDLASVSLRVTPLGSRLVLEQAPADPLVDDARRDGSERD